jgi:hypothetical protein
MASSPLHGAKGRLHPFNANHGVGSQEAICRTVIIKPGSIGAAPLRRPKVIVFESLYFHGW